MKQGQHLRREQAVTGAAAAPPTAAAAMAEAAGRFLDLLDDGQRDRAAFGPVRDSPLAIV